MSRIQVFTVGFTVATTLLWFLANVAWEGYVIWRHGMVGSITESWRAFIRVYPWLAVGSLILASWIAGVVTTHVLAGVPETVKALLSRPR